MVIAWNTISAGVYASRVVAIPNNRKPAEHPTRMVASKGLPDRLSSKNGAENGFMAVSKVASAQDGEALVEVMSAMTRNEKENAVALPPDH